MHEDISCQVKDRRSSSDSDKAYIIPTLRTELIPVKSLNSQGYKEIHDADPEESGIFPVLNWKIEKLKTFAFMIEHSNLFYIKAEAMSVQRFGKVSGNEKWQRRLGHTTNREIHDTIPYVWIVRTCQQGLPAAYKMCILHDKKKYSGRFP